MKKGKNSASGDFMMVKMWWVKSKVDGLGSKWMVHGGYTELSKRLKVDGHILNRAVYGVKI